jgi:single-stranded DNA-specific DHH superfamily exonuclease
VWTEREILKDALTLSNVINACGKLDHAGTGVAVCLRDERFLDEALEIHRKYCTKILRELNRAVESIESMSSLKYVWVENEGITGAVAGVLARYVVRDFPVLALRRIDGIVRISARGNEELIERGVDLGDIMRISAQRVGGQGGGHSIAAGASVPEREIAEFLKNVNEEVQKRLAK